MHRHGFRVQAHHTNKFLDEVPVVWGPETLHAMRLEAVVLPDSLHRGLTRTNRPGRRCAQLHGAGLRLLIDLPSDRRLFPAAKYHRADDALGFPLDPRYSDRNEPVSPDFGLATKPVLDRAKN